MRKFYFPVFALFMLLLLFGNSFAQGNDSTAPNQNSDDEKVYKQSEVDQRAKIIKKSIPSTDRMCGDGSGLVRVTVVLRKSGRVSDVKFLKASECRRFNENSVDSAKKIKFNPAIKDGQPVSVSAVVEYTYRRY